MMHRSQSPTKKSTPWKTLSRQAGGFGTITGGTVKSEWNFDETIRMTMKGAPIELDLAELSDNDEWEMDSGSGTARVRGKGHMQGGHNVSPGSSAGQIKLISRTQASEVSLPLLDSSSMNSPSLESAPRTPNGSDSEDANSSQGGTPGKSTWRQRNDKERGTVVKRDDVGDG